MQFESLHKARFVKRYKRFLVDLRLENGEVLTAHCPNTGAMTGCTEPDALAYYSLSNKPARKYPATLEWLQLAAGHRVCINTQRPNGLVAEAIAEGRIDALSGYSQIASERPYGREGSRVDLLLSGHSRGQADCYVEVKNVTLYEHGCGYFPDAVSVRALKHLRELMFEVSRGARAALVFCVNHSAITRLRPAQKIHHDYAVLLREAAEAGVELLAYRSEITPAHIRLVAPVPIELEA